MRSLLSYMAVAREYLVETSQSFDPHAPWEERLDWYRTYCLALEMLACGELLTGCNAPRFFLHLLRAAANWREWLAQLREAGTPCPVPASLNSPLLAAIACRNVPLACELAMLSTRELTPPEYEDEFCAAFFLQEYVRSHLGQERDTADLHELCQRVDESLGERSQRTQVYRALADNDWLAFGAAFRDWNEVTAQARARADAPGATFSMGITRHIWLEGLALLQLAQMAGGTLEPELRPLLPELVQHPPSSPPSGDLWLLGQVRLCEEDA